MEEPITTAVNPPKVCDHKGKWQGLGTTVVTFNQILILIHNLFCSECGETKIISNRIPFPEPEQKPKIAVPIMIPKIPK